MNTTRLKSFATEARNILRRGVMNRLLTLGFDQDGNVVQEPTMFEGGAVFMGETISEDFYNKWISLRDRIASHSLREVLEEAAYTWFNRLMAIRIMQKNGLIDPVLDYRSDSVRLPILLTNAQAGNIPTMPKEDHERLHELLNDPTRTAEQFAILITAFCHNTPVINACFGKLADYTELLLPNDILEENGFLDKLNHTDFINDEDYISPELIGWLYQFYISERKDEVFAKKGKYDPDEIPAATQIFTPNWIVKYMVQNTVGRIYLDNNPYEDELKSKWKYLVENDQQGEKLEINDLADMKVADLACGSGHILNECFDLLLDLYINEGYNRRQAIESIFANNLTGVDIDTRAKQLATFALLLKACQNDKSFIDAHVIPHVIDMPDVDRYTWRDLNGHMACALQIQGANETVYKELDECFTLMENANSLGSIMKFDISPKTREFILLCLNEHKRQQKFIKSFANLFSGFEIILALTEKYSALVMNPPYMGSRSMGNALVKYINDNYIDGKADFCTVFMILQANRTVKDGYYGLITPPSWMFNSSFENLRRSILDFQSIKSLLYLSRGVFGADFGSVSCVIQNTQNNNSKGTYFRLIERTFQEFDQNHLRILFEKTLSNHNFKYFFGGYTKDVEEIVYNENGAKIYYPNVAQSIFYRIPGSALGFWASEKMADAFSFPTIGSISAPRQGMATSDNNRFLRLWYEPNYKKIAFNCKSREESKNSKCRWFPYNKGGSFRKWYGNNDYLVNWENDGEELLSFAAKLYGSPTRTIKNIQHYFKDSVTWSALSSGAISLRYSPHGFLFDTKGQCIFSDTREQKIKIMAFLNSKPSVEMLKILAPTWDFNSGVIAKLPFNGEHASLSIIDNCISICKDDWDAHETSWDFLRNELIAIDEPAYWDILNEYCNYTQRYVEPPAQIEIQSQLQSLSWLTYFYETKWEIKFRQLHANEEELNRQFIEIYGLQDELKPDVPLDDVTILQGAGSLGREISIENNEIVWHDDVIMKQLISYAVGCWMGRYRLDKPGLHIAHTDATREEIAPYEYKGEPFEIDDDGIIPLMPKDCMFHDNAAQRLADFVRQVFGDSTQIENLNFIEDALGMTVEQYFIKQFWKDHKKMYQNRPIYWLFSSKKGAFQCLAYMHRMDAYTVERVRQKYLLPHMEDLRRRIAELAERAATLNTQERKTLESLNKQLDECMEYHDRLHPVADKQIAFDLDDGVVVNYAKFGDILAKLK